MPNGFTIDKTKSANEIIFISFNSNIYTDEFPTQLSTRLLNSERFTVTRETRNERRIKQIGLDNFFNITEVTKADEGIIKPMMPYAR